MLINKQAVKKYALEYCKERRPKFTRTSNEFVLLMESILAQKIRDHINSHPSIGVTIK